MYKKDLDAVSVSKCVICMCTDSNSEWNQECLAFVSVTDRTLLPLLY